jgi:hypothetical protein
MIIMTMIMKNKKKKDYLVRETYKELGHKHN